MIELRGIARRLRLSVDQLRLASDLLEQGYHPGFIERYRADETGCLPRSALWALKLEIDRQERLQAARERARAQLPKDAVLDEEAEKHVQLASSEVEIETALRCFRARRNLQQSQDRDEKPGQLLESLISHADAPPADVIEWASERLQVDRAEAEQVVEQTKRLIATLIQCDTGLMGRLRNLIDRRARLEVVYCDTGGGGPDSESEDSTADAEATHAEDVSDADASEESDSDTHETLAVDSPENSLTPDSDSTSFNPNGVAGSDNPDAQVSSVPSEDATASNSLNSDSQPGDCSTSSSTLSSSVEDNEAESSVAAESPAGQSTQPSPNLESSATAEQPSTSHDDKATAAVSADATDASDVGNLIFKSKRSPKSTKTEQKAGKKKAFNKLTPRQRRRRWLAGMLQPMKSLKCSVTKLTAYQQLMLGRGRRSQLVKANLIYDQRSFVNLARDTFVTEKHPLAPWFEEVISNALAGAITNRIELDALSHLEEHAQERLLETAADQLRQNLMQRPIRGHVIMVVDTVGPKTSSVAIVDPDGKVLITDEITCSAHPDVVNQNMVRLGELAHRFKVTLVVLTNGPARRFLILTIRELMKQSATSGLRWTMADRGGAEAYAAGRIALRELPAHNRRDRAAIWVARSLQNPLGSLLKVDINRLRLGSYQRELPQEPLKKLIRETIADCICTRGIDAYHAGVDGLMSVCGIDSDQARQIAALAASGDLKSRENLLAQVADWPEKQARQAIGFLRVFGSEQPLDATLIHPEDYRLAERIIAQTDLESPPSAPEGWQPPQPETTASEPVEASKEDHSQQDSTAAEPSEASETNLTADLDANQPVAEIASPESPSDEPSDSPDSSPASADVGTEAGTPDSATAEESSSTSENAGFAISEGTPPEGSGAAPSEPEATAKSDSSDNLADLGDSSPRSSATPEYPEEIVANRQSQPNVETKIDVEKLARSWQVGREKLRWVAKCLNDPFGDPRLQNTPVPLLSEMPTLSSLQPDTCLWAVVVGVADFGAFVEIAPECSGLVHISRLSSTFVEDPHEIVQVGDLVMVWVVSVDEKKNRVALTALSPEQRALVESQKTERPPRREPRQGGSGPSAESGGRHEAGSSGHVAPRGGARDEGRRDAGGRDPRAARDQRGRRDQRGGDRGRSGGRPGRRDGGRTSKPIIVTSKKPKTPISDAMREGEEPLRSFSDLLQFYEAKRTDAPVPKTSEEPPKPVDPPEAAAASAEIVSTPEESVSSENENES